MTQKQRAQHDDVLNADEASTWLKIPKTTLYKLCHDGDIPAAKVGRHWRFHRETLEDWFLSRTQERQKYVLKDKHSDD